MFRPRPGGRLIFAWLDGVGARRCGIGRVLVDPPEEGGRGSLCWQWSFGQRAGHEGPNWEAEFFE